MGRWIEGRCPNCGVVVYGWALRFPRNQSCFRCGAGLDILEDGKLVATGQSPFEGEPYSAKAGDGGTPASEGQDKGAAGKKGPDNA